MRILRLRVDGRRMVDLHPAISVLPGLDAEQAARLRRGVAAVTSGLAPDGGGLVEAHGMLLDAVQDDLDLLDLSSDPVAGVVTTATLALMEQPAAAEDEALDRLGAAERDALLLATDRRWAAAARQAAAHRPEAGERELERAEQLRLAVELHEATDVEPLRVALDRDRDASRRADDDPSAIDELASALARLGIRLDPRTAGAAEVRRVAEDLLDEHQRHAAWIVGARVELAGLERRLHEALDPGPSAGRPTLPESIERRAERATTAHADAIVRADALRDELVATPAAGPEPLERALVAAVTARERQHVAGTAPLLLDRVLTGRADDEVAALLDRLAPLTRGVQLLVLDTHPAAVAWAQRVEPATAAVVAPTPAPRLEGSPTMPATPT